MNQLANAGPIKLEASAIRQPPRLLLWLVITAVLLLIKGQVENNKFGRGIEEWTYGVLQYSFYASGGRVRPNALVINLDKPLERWERDGRSDIVTPREPLKKLLELLANKGARGVAIDVDFSPADGQPIHPDDAGFFRFCLDLSRRAKMPIALGVWRTRLQPYNWLISDEFHTLAAAYDIPKSHPEWAVRWIKADGADERLPSLAARLTKTDDADRGYAFWDWAIRSTSKIHYDVGYSTAYSPIDFTDLWRLEEDALPTQDTRTVSYFGDKIRGRYILLGRTNPSSEKDRFDVPHLRPVPGIFLHASAALTLAGKPLNTMTPWGRVMFDVVIAALIYCVVMLSCAAHHRTGVFAFLSNERIAQYVFTVVAIIIVLVVSVGLVRRTRLLWTDFVLLCLVLMFHPLLDELLHWLTKQFPKLLTRMNSLRLHSK